MINRLVCLLLVCVCLDGSRHSVCYSQQRQPNVLLIAVDDLNDWVGCLGGHPQAKTPNIDRLANRGMLFTNAHCQGPICGPSRTSLLSGYYPHTTGVYLQPTKALQKDKKYIVGHTLPEYFAKHGYRTTSVGKISHGVDPKIIFQTSAPNYGTFGPKPDAGKRFNYMLPDVPYSGTQTDWGAFPDKDELMPDHQAATFAETFLEKVHDDPFFLAVGFYRPHVPFYVPEKWFKDFPLEEIEIPVADVSDLDDVPPIGVAIHELPKYPSLKFLEANGNDQFKKCVQAYLASIAFVDHQVGRVLSALEQSGYADNTIVVLFSDHGYHLGEKDRVSKHSLWEESTRVPLVIVPNAGNGQLKLDAGAKTSKPVGLIDLYPTLVDLCGLPENPKNEGYSLVPLMNAPKDEWQFAALTTYARGCHSLRSERFRFIQYSNGEEELYDHELDPDEFDNVARRDEYQEVVFRFRLELPRRNAKYHPATSKKPINRWFDEHLQSEGVR